MVIGETHEQVLEPQRPARRRTRWWLLAALLVPVLAAGGWWAWSSRRPDPQAVAIGRALSQLTARGGPSGWRTEPTGSGLANMRQERRGALDVVYVTNGREDTGAGITWTTEVPAGRTASTAVCRELARWMHDVVSEVEMDNVVDSCTNNVREPPGGGSIIDWYSHIGPEGRWDVSAAADQAPPGRVRLLVSAEYGTPDPTEAPGAQYDPYPPKG
jgi:hypothetical protein